MRGIIVKLHIAKIDLSGYDEFDDAETVPSIDDWTKYPEAFSIPFSALEFVKKNFWNPNEDLEPFELELIFEDTEAQYIQHNSFRKMMNKSFLQQS